MFRDRIPNRTPFFTQTQIGHFCNVALSDVFTVISNKIPTTSVGKDASLAFITGDFTESGLTDDVSSLSPLQVVALYDWLAFYQRDYQAVGVLTGRFYTETGQPTEALLQVEASRAEGQRIKAQSEAEMLRFPACNSEWSAARGGRVWCSTKSGGVQRGWTGVPRKLFSPGSSGVRCVCVEDPSAADDDPNMHKYDGCPSHADSCSVEDF
ncbi:neuferricin isoform X2 [Centropristis striata]|uniref:neuferricin isoform X2 n=1 Tax=Centropristis striata TaxID=184440 RepID=UPI0027E1A39F|nr:neuferricin isoform X2 [Centropristis striata]